MKGLYAGPLLAAAVFFLARQGVVGEDGATRGARPCIIYQTSPRGLCSNLHGLLMTIALYGNATDIYLDESSWAYKCGNDRGSWHEFFAGPSPRDLSDAPSPGDCEVLKYEGCPRCGHNVLADVPVATAFALLGEAAKQLWQLSSSMQRLADIQNAWLASLPRPLIAIHIQGGDKAHEDREAGREPEWYKEHEWVLKLQELLRNNGLQVQEGVGTCLVFGDDLHAMHQAVIPLQSTIQCPTIIFGGKGHNEQAMNANMTRADTCPVNNGHDPCPACPFQC